MIFPLADWRLGATISVRFKTLSSSGLGHSPFTGVTRVRIPLGSCTRIHLLRLYNPSNKIAFFFGGRAEDRELIESDMTYAFSGGCPTRIHYPRPEDIVCKIDQLRIFRISVNWARNLNNYGENATL